MREMASGRSLAASSLLEAERTDLSVVRRVDRIARLRERAASDCLRRFREDLSFGKPDALLKQTGRQRPGDYVESSN
jgi:hypothetical protein